MPASFFEAIAIADRERTHSQVLAWLLRPGDDAPLTTAERCDLALQLFGVMVAEQEAAEWRVETEVNSLDLVIVTGPHLFVVENKLKSSQSPEQLRRYDAAIANVRRVLGLDGAGETHKIFLTFIGEAGGAEGWTDVPYECLLAALQKYRNTGNYFRDYVAYLQRLIECRDTFISDHQAYARVFKLSGMKNEKRLTENLDGEPPVVRFAFANRLERKLCEALLVQVSKSISGSHYIGESRGTALIDTEIASFKATDNACKFKCALQLQGRTVKFNVGGEIYAEGKSQDIAPIREALDKAVFNVARDFQMPPLRRNSDRGKAYRSWSYHLPEDERLEAQSLDTFIADHVARLDGATAFWNAVLEALVITGIIREVVALRQ